MDLISREATIETLALNTDYQTPEGIKNELINHPGKECDWLGGIDEAISIIEELPSVAAVPLDKLCEWLGENSINIPCESCPYFSNDYCTAIGDTSKPCPKTADYWRQAITKWMEVQDAKEKD